MSEERPPLSNGRFPDWPTPSDEFLFTVSEEGRLQWPSTPRVPGVFTPMEVEAIEMAQTRRIDAMLEARPSGLAARLAKAGVDKQGWPLGESLIIACAPKRDTHVLAKIYRTSSGILYVPASMFTSDLAGFRDASGKPHRDKSGAPWLQSACFIDGDTAPGAWCETLWCRHGEWLPWFSAAELVALVHDQSQRVVAAPAEQRVVR